MFYRGFENSLENQYFGRYTPENTYNFYDEIRNYNREIYPNNSSFGRTAWQKDLYPEIYNIVYPIVCNVCSRSNMMLNKENLDYLVDEVYSKVEDDSDFRNEEKNKTKENQDTRNERNNLLRDIIKILIIREFFPRRRPSHNHTPRPSHRDFQMMPYYSNDYQPREMYHPFPEEYM